MSAQKLIISQMLLLFILLNLNGVLTIKRDHKQRAQNQTDPLYNKERDPRQYTGGFGGGPGFGDYGLSSFGGPIEAIIIGLLVVAGFAVVGIPFFLLFLGLFNGGGGGLLSGVGGGLNLVPTTTTTVAGRRKREVNSLFPGVNPMVQQKLFTAFENFVRTPDKIKVIEKLFDSMVGSN